MSEGRMKSFKNKGKDAAELRKKRNDNIIELRKNRKDEQMTKRRNMPQLPEDPPILPPRARGYDSVYITQLAQAASSTDPSERFRAVQTARKMVAQQQDPPINELIRVGFVPILVESLKWEQHTQIQFEAAWALTNIASGTSEQTHIVVRSGAVSLFIALLSSTDKYVAEQCVWALGNITGDGPQLRDYVISQGIIPPLLERVTPQSPVKFLRTLAWTISNLCRNKEPPPPVAAMQQLIPALIYLVQHADREIKTDACWAFAFIADSTPDMVQLVVNANIIPFIVTLLYSQENRVILPALRTLGSVVAGSDSQTQAVLEAGFLPPLKALLLHQKENIVREAVWALSNVTAGNVNQVQMVIEAELIPLVVDILRTRSFKTQKEAAWTLCNMTAGGKIEHIAYLVRSQAVPPMCDMLECKDTQIIMVILDGIQNILKCIPTEEVKMVIEECKGLDKIEALQQHENMEVYKLAFNIVDKHFQSTDDVDQTLAPQNQGENFAFSGQLPDGGFEF